MFVFALLVCGLGVVMSGSGCAGSCAKEREVCYFSNNGELILNESCCPGSKCTPKGFGVGLCTPEDYCLAEKEVCNDQNDMELFTIYTRSDCCSGLACSPRYDDPSVHECTSGNFGR